MNLSFPISESLFPAKVRHAVDEYWHGRISQASRQQRRGVRDVGTRSEVTGGGQLDAFGNILQEVAWGAGYEPSEVAFRPALYLPGFYRPQKRWDLVVFRKGRIDAAVELKSQAGSFKNNFNNRAEESLGLARDFWVAYRENAFGPGAQPWLGYFFLTEPFASLGFLRFCKSFFAHLAAHAED